MQTNLNPHSPAYPGRAAVIAALQARVAEAEQQVAYWMGQVAKWDDKVAQGALYRAEYTLGAVKSHLERARHFPIDPSVNALDGAPIHST